MQEGKVKPCLMGDKICGRGLTESLCKLNLASPNDKGFGRRLWSSSLRKQIKLHTSASKGAFWLVGQRQSHQSAVQSQGAKMGKGGFLTRGFSLRLSSWKDAKKGKKILCHLYTFLQCYIAVVLCSCFCYCCCAAGLRHCHTKTDGPFSLMYPVNVHPTILWPNACKKVVF